MGLLENLRRRFTASSVGQPAGVERAKTGTDGFAALPDDNYQPVVGESHYQRALGATARLCTPGEDGRPMFRAYLIAEPENQYDHDAIGVHSDVGQLGHLSREDAQRYKTTIAHLAARGYAGGTCAAFLNGGDRNPPNYGVVLKLARPGACERHLGIALGSRSPRSVVRHSDSAASKTDAGKLRGKHYTEYVEDVRVLRRYGNDGSAETLLLELVDVVEAESEAQGWGVAPWYYEQLAIIYRKRRDFAAEVGILERFAGAPHAPGASPPKLLDRLEKARALAARSEEP